MTTGLASDQQTEESGRTEDMGTTGHGRHFPIGSPPNESLVPSSPAQPVVAASKPVLPRWFRSEADPRLVDRGVHQPLFPAPYSPKSAPGLGRVETLW